MVECTVRAGGGSRSKAQRMQLQQAAGLNSDQKAVVGLALMSEAVGRELGASRPCMKPRGSGDTPLERTDPLDGLAMPVWTGPICLAAPQS